MATSLEGKTILISGAAGGIGRATAIELARRGAKLVVSDLAGSPIEETLSAVEKAGAAGLALAVDVTQESDWERAVARCIDHFGGLDVLFNNAGIEGRVTPLESYPTDVFDQVMAVNVRGVFLGMKHAIPALRARGGGSIVNISSVAGLSGTAGICAYNASKHAVIGLTKNAAAAHTAEGIRVNAICPSPIETRMMRSLEAGFSAEAPEVVHDAMAKAIPAGRYGEPEEIAALVAFLCSDEARFICGATIPIDGAMTVSGARI